MSQHHPFWVPRGARGIDDRGELVGSNRSGGLLVFARETVLVHESPMPALTDLSQAALALSQRPSIDHDDFLEVWNLGPDVSNLSRLLGSGRDDHVGAGVGEDETDQARGKRRVDRDGHGAYGQDTQIRHQPLRSCLADERDAVTGPNTKASQSKSTVSDILEELTAGKFVVSVGPTPPKQRRFGIPPRHIEREVGERPYIGLGHTPLLPSRSWWSVLVIPIVTSPG